VYWLLIGMALATFAVCVLLPEWRHLQVLRHAEEGERLRVEQMEALVDHERRLLEAMTSDPGVVARMAQRELGYRPVDGHAVPVMSPVDGTGLAIHATVTEPREIVLPPITAWPPLAFDRVFCDPEKRPILMGMSIALAATAFFLFGARRHALASRVRN
jgi:hypothetical protein